MAVKPMSPTELSAVLRDLHLTQQQAGWIFANPGSSLATGERRLRRWLAGDSTIPNTVAVALRLMVKHGENPRRISNDVIQRGTREHREAVAKFPRNFVQRPKKDTKNGRSVKNRMVRQHLQPGDRMPAHKRGL